MRDYKILIVEDELIQAYYFKDILERFLCPSPIV